MIVPPRHKIIQPIPRASGSRQDIIDYQDRLLRGSCLGIIKKLYYPDDEANNSKLSVNQDGIWLEADVEIIDFPRWKSGGTAGGGNTIRVPIPPTANGYDDYEENTPEEFGNRTIPWNVGQSTPQLTCDFVVIGFLGGNFYRPVFLGYYNHYNGNPDTALRADAPRKYWRKNGARFELDNLGNARLDLVESNRDLGVPAASASGVVQGGEKNPSNQTEGGVSILYLKKGQEVRIVFEDEDTRVSSPETNPSKVRYTEESRLTVKNLNGAITLEASGDVDLTTTGTATVEGSSVLLGVGATDLVTLDSLVAAELVKIQTAIEDVGGTYTPGPVAATKVKAL